jgi:hypothetical protein
VGVEKLFSGNFTNKIRSQVIECSFSADAEIDRNYCFGSFFNSHGMFQQSTVCMGGFGLESGADDLLDRAAIVSGLRGVLPLCPSETSSIQPLVESAGQEEMARTGEPTRHPTCECNVAGASGRQLTCGEYA